MSWRDLSEEEKARNERGFVWFAWYPVIGTLGQLIWLRRVYAWCEYRSGEKPLWRYR